MENTLDNIHITVNKDGKVVVIGRVDKAGNWTDIQDRTPEFLFALFKFAPLGKLTVIEGDGKTFGILIRDITEEREKGEKELHNKKTSNIIGLDGKPLN